MTLPDLSPIAASPEVHLLGWTLVHFVWQAALLAAVLAGVLHALRTHAPQVRYATSCVALITLLGLPVGTALFLSDRGHVHETAVSAVVAAEASELAPVSAPPPTEGGASARASRQHWVAAWIQPALPWLVFGWGLGVLLFAVRFAGGALRVRTLRRNSTPVSETWQDRLQVLAEQMGVPWSVSLRQSARVDSPAVVGWFRPVVLVPVGLLSGVPPEQVAALLRHELAHIRRHDVLVGRLQAVVEAVLFFHPATWWISRQVRDTREACCDDLAIQSGTSRTAYARALATLAEKAVSPGPAAWTPAGSDGSLVSRIRRVLHPDPSPSTRAQRLSTIIGVLVVLAVPVGLASCASQQSTTEGDPEPSTAQATAERRAERDAADGAHADDERGAVTEKRVVVVPRDSTARALQLEPHGPIAADSLEEDAYVIRRGDRGDTIDVPDLEDVEPPFPPDSLERRLRGRFNPDSLERELRLKMNPDSLERVLRAQIDVDSLQRELRMTFDVDSLERRALQMRFRADSIAGWYERNGDSLTARFHPPFDPDSLEREIRIRIRPDRLARWHRKHADSLHRHLDSLRLQWEREMPETLREQARRLRERAERLEERAKEMEDPPRPDNPEETVDGSGPSDAARLNTDEPVFGDAAAFSDRQYARWAKQAAAHIDYDTIRTGAPSLRSEE